MQKLLARTDGPYLTYETAMSRKRVYDTILPTVEQIESLLQCGPVTISELRMKFAVHPLALRPYLILLVASGKIVESLNSNDIKQYGLPGGGGGLIDLYAPTLPTEYTSRIVDASDIEPPKSMRKESGPQQHSVLASVFMGG